VTERVRRGERGIIVITNYATLQYMAKSVEESKTISGKVKKFYHWNRFFPAVYPPSFIVVDEAHKIKNPKALLTQAVLSIPAQGRLLLTATPTDKRPSDFYTQFTYAQPSYKKEFPSYWKFADRYEIRGATPYAPFVFKETRNEAELVARYSRRPKLLIKYDKAQILPDLPPIRPNMVRVEMTPKQKKLYDDFKAKAVVKDENGKWAWATGDSYLRLLQMATVPSSAKRIGGTEVSLTNESSKFEWIADAIEGRDAPVVIYSRFKESLNELEKYLRLRDSSLKVVRITGDEDATARHRAYTSINRGEADVALLTDAGGEAIELTGANHIVFMQMPSTYTQFVQVRDRLHRPGSEVHTSILVTFLLSRGTVDERVYDLIRSGGEVNSRILLSTMIEKGDL
jgi:SNF2 family DNA or RNA helicase